MRDSVKPDTRVIYASEAPLVDTTLIAAWPGMGLVGVNAVEFLRSSLGAHQIAEIDSAGFFALQGVSVKEGLAVPLKMPTNIFHAWRNPAGRGDLLLFLGTAQPVTGRELPLCALVLDVAARLGVKRVFTAAAMASQIDYTAPSRVYGVTNRLEEVSHLAKLGVQMLQEGEIGGLNGLLIGVAQQQGVPGTCLMGEMPHYTTHIENPKASKAVLEVLSVILSIPLDLTPLEERARYIEAQIKTFLQAARERAEASGSSAEPGSSSEGSAEGESAGEDDSPAESNPNTNKGPAIN